MISFHQCFTSLCVQDIYIYLSCKMSLGSRKFFYTVKEEEFCRRLQRLSRFLNVKLWDELIFVPLCENVFTPNMKSHAPMQSSSDFKMIIHYHPDLPGSDAAHQDLIWCTPDIEDDP